jgi:hypothetical protein
MEESEFANTAVLRFVIAWLTFFFPLSGLYVRRKARFSLLLAPQLDKRSSGILCNVGKELLLQVT